MSFPRFRKVLEHRWRRPQIVVSLTGLVLLQSTACNPYQSEVFDPRDTASDSDSDTNSDTDSGSEMLGAFGVMVRLSDKIGTVAIVDWWLENISIEHAYIEYGVDESYDMVAPVDLSEPNHRTLLLGMKPSRKYHFRIKAFDGKKYITSPNRVLQTGPVSNYLPQISTELVSPTATETGFVLSSHYLSCTVFILDADGEYVWWAFPGFSGCSRVHMSHDGKHIYVGDANNSGKAGFLSRINMEGTVEEHIPMQKRHHDFTILPDGTIALIHFDGLIPRCDDIVELRPDGKLHNILHLADFIDPPFGDGFDGCHSNSIQYHPKDDTYTLSVLNTHQYIKFNRQGELLWIFGGEKNNYFKSDTWFRQHGHQVLDNGNFLFFNNRSISEASMVFEYALDEKNWIASEQWRFDSGMNSKILGDVQRLPKGNTLITYSSTGKIVEVGKDDSIVRTTSFGLNGGIGYSEWRSTLYPSAPKKLTPF